MGDLSCFFDRNMLVCEGVVESLLRNGLYREASDLIDVLIDAQPDNLKVLNLKSYCFDFCFDSGEKVKSGENDVFFSLGYFSSDDFNYLKLYPSREVVSIRVGVMDRSCWLNLEKIQLYDSSEEPLSKSLYTIRQSSNVFSESYGLVNIHTKREDDPWVEVVFSSPVKLSSICLYNRKDGFGIRSKNLLVSANDILDGKVAFVNDFDFFFHLKSLFKKINITSSMLFDFSNLRSVVIENLGLLMKSSLFSITDEEWRVVLSISSIWAPDQFSEEEIRMFSGYIVYRYIVKKNIDITFISGIFKTRKQLDDLENDVNELLCCYEKAEVVFTRHGLSKKGDLISRRESYLFFLDEVLHFLSSSFYDPILMYGSLLGAYRDKSFIPFDDDIDVGVRVNGVEEVDILKKSLKEKGYDVINVPNCRNFHVVDVKNDLILDVFPLLVFDDEVELHMEKMNIRRLPLDIFYPSQKTKLYEYEFSIPNRVEDFLCERYGTGWNKPDKYFEWNWALEDF